MAKKKLKDKIKEKLKQKKDDIKGFVLLLPFFSIMKMILDKKKIPYQNNIDDVSLKFYNHIVKGQNYSHYYDIENYESFDPATISIIVQAVVGFFKNRKAKLEQKKKEGALPDDELKELNAYNGVEKGYSNLKKQEVQNTIGSIFTDYWYVWVLIIIYVLFGRK